MLCVSYLFLCNKLFQNLLPKKCKHYLVVSVRKEFICGLAGRLWFKVSHRAAVISRLQVKDQLPDFVDELQLSEGSAGAGIFTSKLTPVAFVRSCQFFTVCWLEV